MKSKTMQTPYMFFKQNAGYSYNPKTETPEQGRRKCARGLAKAERDAVKHGIRFDWETDLEGCMCDLDAIGQAGPCTETLYCFAYVISDAGAGEEKDKDTLASLGGICMGDSEIDASKYRRVIEAELAQEALGVLERRQA